MNHKIYVSVSQSINQSIWAVQTTLSCLKGHHTVFLSQKDYIYPHDISQNSACDEIAGCMM